MLGEVFRLEREQEHRNTEEKQSSDNDEKALLILHLYGPTFASGP